MALLSLFYFLGIAMALQYTGDRLTIPGWNIQSTRHVQGNSTELSLPGADVSSWYRIGHRATVLGGLVEAGVYNESDLFYSDHLSNLNESEFHVPWLYREEFSVPPLAADQRLILDIHGVSSKADMFLNGQQIVSRDIQNGAYAGRSYDITALVHAGVNALLIQAYPTNYLKDLAVGWADWSPYPPDMGMGVWRAVELKLIGPVSISPPRVTTNFSHETQEPLAVSITIKTDLANYGTQTQDATVRGVIRLPDTPLDIALFKRVKLPPRSNSIITLNAVLGPAQVKVWWPAAWGSQPLYQVQLAVSLSTNTLSDQSAPTNFALRSVGSSLNAHGENEFTVNGHPFHVRGAGYAPDLFLRFDLRRLEAIFRYTLDMGLNTIRLEGKQEHPELYDLADRMGIMLIAGWECCDKWEGWTYNQDAQGVKWRDEDYKIGYASMLHEAEMMQPHPSMLAFLVGSDYWPDERATTRYLSALRRMNWPNPVIASASSRGHPSQLPPSGMKMEGPYAWVPPNYWYGSELGAAFGFGSEQGAGVGTPELSSLHRFLSSTDLETLWTNASAGHYHLSPKGSVFHNRTIYNKALVERYGRPSGLEDYVLKAQIMDYEATRAEFEAFAARQNSSHPATGVIYWMLNSAWPSLHWQLFDYYLRPAGAYFGAKVGARQEHVVLDYGSNTVYLVNHSLQSKGVRRVTADLIDTNGQTLVHREVRDETAPTSSKEVMSIPEIGKLKLDDVAFLRLVLSDDSNTTLSRNVYWVTAHVDALDWDASNWYTTPVASYANYTALSKLSPARVKTSVSVLDRPTPTLTHIEVHLENTGNIPAFFLRLTAQDPAGEELAPVFWSDNYVTLFPQEQLRLVVEVRQSAGWVVKMAGGNVAESTIGSG